MDNESSMYVRLDGDNFTIEDVQAFTNTQYCFVINPLACSPGSFDLGDSIAEAFVNTEHGAFATIQNARIGYDSSHWSFWIGYDSWYWLFMDWI